MLSVSLKMCALGLAELEVGKAWWEKTQLPLPCDLWYPLLWRLASVLLVSPSEELIFDLNSFFLISERARKGIHSSFSPFFHASESTWFEKGPSYISHGARGPKFGEML